VRPKTYQAFGLVVKKKSNISPAIKSGIKGIGSLFGKTKESRMAETVYGTSNYL